jgi:hypothetical protein
MTSAKRRILDRYRAETAMATAAAAAAAHEVDFSQYKILQTGEMPKQLQHVTRNWLQMASSAEIPK